MEAPPRPRVPIWIVFGLVALLGLASYAIFELFDKVHSEMLPATISEIGKELVKTIFIGVCVGAFIELYMKLTLTGDPSKEMLEKSGIEHIYPARKDAAKEFMGIIEDKKTEILYIAGISLRDFLTQHGNLRSVWDSICGRLENEEKINLPEKKRLRVRLLLLDPWSSEGYFRYRVEEPLAVNNPVNIVEALIEVMQMQQQIYKSSKDFLQVRLYEHCPFSFLFLTNKKVFVEQYYFKDHTKHKDHTKEVTLPLIKYHSNTPRFGALRGSLDIIWKHTHSERIEVGTAIPIDKARIKNIFREDKRKELTERQLECIRNTQTGTIDILAISGTHYVTHNPTLETLLDIATIKEGKESVMVRFALVNPVSQQAILRAVADNRATRKIRETLCNWTWEMHRRSRLYTGVHDSINTIVDWKKTGYSVELRLYSSSVACALLLTSDSAFIEQYIYGRSKKLQERQLIAREYPLIEYGISELETEDKTEQEIISCTFKIVWDHYSISYDEYESRKEEEEFDKNLDRLREELGCVIANR